LIMCCSDMSPLYWGDLFEQIPCIEGICSNKSPQYKGFMSLQHIIKQIPSIQGSLNTRDVFDYVL